MNKKKIESNLDWYGNGLRNIFIQLNHIENLIKYKIEEPQQEKSPILIIISFLCGVGFTLFMILIVKALLENL